MFGKLNRNDKIKQLGWITLDTECQADFEEGDSDEGDSGSTTPVQPVRPTPTPAPRPRPEPTDDDNSWMDYLHQLFEDSLWGWLSEDVDAKMQQPQGYVGYPGNSLAVEIFAHNQQDLRLNAKLNASNDKSNTGYYLGCATVITAIALGAYAFSNRGQKAIHQNSTSEESFTFQV